MYDNRINYSTLYLDINEVERETNVATELTYGEEIRQGLSDTMYDIGQGFRDFSIWFIVNLPVLLIWAVIIIVIVLIIRKILKVYEKRQLRKRASRLEASKKGAEGVWTQATAANEAQNVTEENAEKK